ncbi:hypothetical protein BDV26DRAFT_253058 [Aspergillus bertholletiae]|uniref:Uncharacterized protein n=1 Tax=Aspergillus bertholletiae TaxID=1226010 RepID=A0A5N7BLU8_9EURO|nr:hypothetical protein BDV26DRAFT_253058 [Aspergillus bertholletiae]
MSHGMILVYWLDVTCCTRTTRVWSSRALPQKPCYALTAACDSLPTVPGALQGLNIVLHHEPRMNYCIARARCMASGRQILRCNLEARVSQLRNLVTYDGGTGCYGTEADCLINTVMQQLPQALFMLFVRCISEHYSHHDGIPGKSLNRLNSPPAPHDKSTTSTLEPPCSDRAMCERSNIGLGR